MEPDPLSTPQRRPHVLYVAWGFPPHRGPGTYRALATANLLAELDCRVTVLTADMATFDLVIGGDHSLMTAVDPRIQVLRVPFPPGRRDPVINRWEPGRVAEPTTWLAQAVAKEERVFPEPLYGPWRPRIEAAAQRLHRVDPVQLVVATGNPYVDFSVAQRLNVDDGVPFVLDDRDSWVVDVYTGEPYPQSARTQQWLGWMLQRCEQAWFVNPPIAQWHQARYPEQADRIRVVENGWDRHFLDPAAVRRTAGERLIVGYVGTILERFPLEMIIDGWRRARAASALLADAELRFFGHLGMSGSGLAGQQARLTEAAEHGVVHMGRWPKTRIGEAYSDIDVLLFAKEGSRMVTSGKVYEYVATGLPIASVLDPSHDAQRVLSGYPRWYPAAREDAASLAAALVAAAQDSASHTAALVESAVGYGERFRRDHLLAPVLRGLVERLAVPA